MAGKTTHRRRVALRDGGLGLRVDLPAAAGAERVSTVNRKRANFRLSCTEVI
jgi:hypothetical protein